MNFPMSGREDWNQKLNLWKTLSGWNYSIQTGENIATNESTWINNSSHGLYLNLTDDSQPQSICLSKP